MARKLSAVPDTSSDEISLDDLDLEELEDMEDEEPAPAPVKKATPKKTVAKKATPKKATPVVEEPEELEELDEEPAPVVKKATPRKAAPKAEERPSVRESVENAGGASQWLAGYVEGKFGLQVDSDRAFELRETLSVAGVGYDHPLLARLLGVDHGETPQAAPVEASRPANSPKAKPAPKSAPKASSAPKKAAPKASGSAVDLGAVRAWAQTNGYEVGDRGRIKGEILEAYAEANA